MFSYLSLLEGYNLTKLEIPEDPCSYPSKRLIIRGTFLWLNNVPMHLDGPQSFVINIPQKWLGGCLFW